MVETPRLQAKKRLAKSTKVDEPGFVEMRNHGELLLLSRLQADNLRTHRLKAGGVFSSAIRSAVPGADQEVEKDLSPRVVDELYLAHSVKMHLDRRQ